MRITTKLKEWLLEINSNFFAKSINQLTHDIEYEISLFMHGIYVYYLKDCRTDGKLCVCRPNV